MPNFTRASSRHPTQAIVATGPGFPVAASIPQPTVGGPTRDGVGARATRVRHANTPATPAERVRGRLTLVARFPREAS